MSRCEHAVPHRACGGFSYLWVLMLVALMGVGLTVAAEVHSVASQRDKERELIAIGRQFRTAIGRYYESGNRQFPNALSDLLRDERVPGVRRHLRKIFIDPMTGKAEWGLVRCAGRIIGVHSLSKKKPIKQDGFEPEEAALGKKSAYSEWVFSYRPPAGAAQPGPGAPGAATLDQGDVSNNMTQRNEPLPFSGTPGGVPASDAVPVGHEHCANMQAVTDVMAMPNFSST